METIELDNFLKELNFTDAERKVIIELAFTQGYSIGEIIKKTGLHRGTTYNTLQRLIEKGVVGMVKTDYGKQKYIINTNAFLAKILEEKNKLKEKENFAKEFIKSIKNIPKLNEKENEPGIFVFYGKDAYKNFLINHDVEAGKSNKIEYYIGQPTTIYYISKEFEAFHMNLKKQLNVFSKTLYSIHDKDPNFFSLIKNEKLKWLNKKLMPNMPIFIRKNNLVIVDFNVRPYKIIDIRDKNIVNLHKELFEILWGDSNTVSKEEIYN